MPPDLSARLSKVDLPNTKIRPDFFILDKGMQPRTELSCLIIGLYSIKLYSGLSSYQTL